MATINESSNNKNLKRIFVLNEKKVVKDQKGLKKIFKNIITP